MALRFAVICILSLVASGVYFYHIESGTMGRVGRLTIINDRPGF